MDLCKISLLNIDSKEKKEETKIALQGHSKPRRPPARALLLAPVAVLLVLILIQVTCFSGNLLLAAPIKVLSSETESIQLKKTIPVEFEERPLLGPSHNRRLVDGNSSDRISSQNSEDLTQRAYSSTNNNSNFQSVVPDTSIIKERFGEVKGHLLLLFALLVLINLIVIFGNILVILAVYATAKLRNVTNIFIVSLATADLLLGVFVLPYALMFEVSRSGWMR